jgi:hypothetical protein
MPAINREEGLTRDSKLKNRAKRDLQLFQKTDLIIACIAVIITFGWCFVPTNSFVFVSKWIGLTIFVVSISHYQGTRIIFHRLNEDPT